MYAKRIQIDNYGPIDHLDFAFPFEGDAPKPIVLVGENGSGKSILLSHIVNGLIAAQSSIYRETPEVEVDKVYKLRSNSYVKSEKEFYFSRVDFEDNLFIEEIRSLRLKREASDAPSGLTGADARAAWEKMERDKCDYIDSPFFINPLLSTENNQEEKIKGIFSRNCILYFPPNRFEEPAWLNEENLKAKAEYMNLKHLQGHTDRKVIKHSPLRDNQNWLFEVLFDRCAFEVEISQVPLNTTDENQKPQNIRVPLFKGYRGKAASIYENILSIIRLVFQEGGDLQFGIGDRRDRKFFLMQGNKTLVPNIFQLSSGETSLLNLFLSVLRNFDLSGTPFTKNQNIRGIVIVDEIELHLHAVHQHEVLPNLVKMFPRVQFIVTTHSPLFVLGMEKTFGKDGFALYQLPQGEQIGPEEFGEFGSAYKSFKETRQFLNDVQNAIKESQKPVLFIDGETDVKYLQKAATLLGRQATLQRVLLRDGEGFGNLDKIWNKFDSKLSEFRPQKVILLHDCDKPGCKEKGNVYRRSIPKKDDHPLQAGIENLFEKTTLRRAIEGKDEFIDISGGHTDTIRGETVPIPEKWTVNDDEKTNLCNWLCENGTAADFKHFQVIFDLLEEILTNDQEITTPVAAGELH